MDFIRIGKIVNTHGIKGEIRLLSNFEKKNRVFIKGFKIYIGNEKEEFIIKSYRKHKNFDMLILEGISNINEVLKYKGKKVFINREDLNLGHNEYLLDDLLNLKIVSDNAEYGVVENIFDNNGCTLLYISFEKKYYIPYNNEYIKEVDLQNKIIYVNNVKDLII